ncbi:MAG: DUF5615 family PIN-like protein [Acidimicrobiales bacterium]
MRLALDHHYSTRIAIELRRRGHDVVAAIEEGWQAAEDEALLEDCARVGRALLTNNVSDFTAIARRWAIEGRAHRGLIFTSDTSMPRSRHTTRRYVAALDALLTSNPSDGAFVDRVHWL